MIPIQTLTNMAKRQLELPTEMLAQNIDSYLGELNDMQAGTQFDGSMSTLNLSDDQQLNPESTQESAQISPNPNFSVVPFENPMTKMNRLTSMMKGDPTAILESGIETYMQENDIITPQSSFNVVSFETPKSSPPVSNDMTRNTERQQFNVASGQAVAQSENLSASSVDESSPQARSMSGSFDSLGVINSANNGPPPNRRDYT